MEAVEYVLRPTIIRAYQFLCENADEFIKMLWEWNYLTHLSRSDLTFQANTDALGKNNPIYRIHDTQYLVESVDSQNLWKIEIMDQREFNRKFMPFVPQTDDIPVPTVSDSQN